MTSRWPVLAAAVLVLAPSTAARSQLRPDPEALAQAPAELLDRLRADPYTYFRFTNRAWTTRVCEAFATTPDVPVVRLHGDAHVEQFAVTSDAWGLDDFDDSARGAMVVDVVRFLGSLDLAGRRLRIAHLPSLDQRGLDVGRLPFSLRVLLENLLRREDGRIVGADHIEAVARWRPGSPPSDEIAFMPARVLLQDFTGVPAVADLAAMRDAMVALGGDARRINPLQPVELVIDHSVQVDEYGTASAFQRNSSESSPA